MGLELEWIWDETKLICYSFYSQLINTLPFIWGLCVSHGISLVWYICLSLELICCFISQLLYTRPITLYLHVCEISLVSSVSQWLELICCSNYSQLSSCSNCSQLLYTLPFTGYLHVFPLPVCPSYVWLVSLGLITFACGKSCAKLSREYLKNCT